MEEIIRIEDKAHCLLNKQCDRLKKKWGEGTYLPILHCIVVYVLALKANIPLPTYKQFIYAYKISFENIIKLFIALRLFDNLNGLLKNKEYKTLNEIKQKDKLPKRIDK